MISCVKEDKCFCTYSVTLDERTDITDTAQLVIYVCGVNDNFEVMEELLIVIPMHGQTTAQEIFCQLCDAIEDTGLPLKSFAGITSGTSSKKTGRGGCGGGHCSALHDPSAGPLQ